VVNAGGAKNAFGLLGDWNELYTKIRIHGKLGSDES